MAEVMEIDRYEPDYKKACDNCGQKPTVTAVKDGKRVNHWEMCGPCVFGTARALDTEWWNSGDD
jgi:hypothetical protein